MPHQQLSNRRTPLHVTPIYYAELKHPSLDANVSGFPWWLADSSPSRETVQEYLSSYLHAGGFRVHDRHADDMSNLFDRNKDGWDSLRLSWLADDGRDASQSARRALFESKTFPYAGARWFFPDVAGSGKPLHPLLAWWAVLYTLSMLARYEPARWVEHINVDTSPYAVGIEHLLATALDVVPTIIADTIRDVS